jgi:hypothetical protein
VGWVIVGVLLLQLYFAQSLELCAGVGFVAGHFRCNFAQDQAALCIRRWIMKQGGAPTGKRASTTDRERRQEEENDPQKKQKRLEDQAETKKHFFDLRPSGPDPSATVATPTTPAAHEAPLAPTTPAAHETPTTPAAHEAPLARVRVSVFRKDTVKHMEEFCLR